MKYKIFLLLVLALCSCQNHTDEPSDKNTDKGKDSYFTNVATNQSWRSVREASIGLSLPADTRQVTVYARYCDYLYKVTSVSSPKPKTTIMFSIPTDLTDVEVAVDGRLYASPINESLDTRTDPGTPITDEYINADNLGWVLAGDAPTATYTSTTGTHEGDAQDYDFNDIVARIVPLSDGSIEITALAAGDERNVWLHFFDGKTDYIISPYAHNGVWDRTQDVQAGAAQELTWLQWFAKSNDYLHSGSTVNTLGSGGLVGMPGNTVVVPGSVTRDLTLSAICLSDVYTASAAGAYARTTYGFYATIDAYDLDRIDDAYLSDEAPGMYGAIMTFWPAGNKPQMLLIPDASYEDTPGRHIGWQWPSDRSPIDKVYPYFRNYVSDPAVIWSVVSPQGYEGRPGEYASDGSLTTYGFYPR